MESGCLIIQLITIERSPNFDNECLGHSSQFKHYCYILVRKWKKAGGLKGGGGWEFEVGEEPRAQATTAEAGLMESASNVSINLQSCECICSEFIEIGLLYLDF